MARVRITPARAGKTPASRIAFTTSADHPRACGENEAFLPPMLLHEGSPPRVRGKRTATCLLVPEARITPARAGKTCSSLRARRSARDHPRACGENDMDANFIDDEVGSPPRVRGKLPPRRAYLRQGRITPARAGKTKTGCP